MKLFIFALAVCCSQIIGSLASCIRRGVECIEYQVVGRHQGYEERQYPATTWVSMTLESPSLTEANRIMYKKIFSYLQGNNVKGMKINTTTPIRTRIVPCHGATCATMFIMSSVIPTELADNAPYPLDTDLFIEKYPPARYVVRIFDGRPTESDWLEESHKLAELLGKDPTIDRSYYYTAWYDPPYQLFHRTNEIWLARKSPKEAQTTTPSKFDLESKEPKEHKSEIV